MSNQLVQVFKSLADPVRLRLIGLIVDAPRCGQELAAELGIAPATASHHLRLLRKAGLLTVTRESPYVYYQLDHGALQRVVQSVANKRTVSELAAGAGLVADKRRVLENWFADGKLKAIPVQRRKKEIVFEEVLRRLPRRDAYGERELSRMIEAIHADFCTIRREFIMGRYMERSDGTYRLADRGRAALADGSADG